MSGKWWKGVINRREEEKQKTKARKIFFLMASADCILRLPLLISIQRPLWIAKALRLYTRVYVYCDDRDTFFVGSNKGKQIRNSHRHHFDCWWYPVSRVQAQWLAKKLVFYCSVFWLFGWIFTVNGCKSIHQPLHIFVYWIACWMKISEMYQKLMSLIK